MIFGKDGAYLEHRCTLPNGDILTCSAKSAVIRFSAPRKTLATSANCGGLRRDLTAVFNHCDCGEAGVCEPMQGDNLEEHQIFTAKRLGLDPLRTAGLHTAVNLDNLVLREERFEELCVTALVSGGADNNACCAGDPAPLHERAGQICAAPRGTINIILLINQSLSDGALAEAVMTATEAKTAVLRDLMQESCCTGRLATGTGTDGIIAVCNADGEPPLRNAGKHFKLGELIGRAVRGALPEALFRQTGFSAASQHSTLRRLKRYGVTSAAILAECSARAPEQAEACRAGLLRMEKDGFVVTASSLCAHLLDQVESGMLPLGEAAVWLRQILDNIALHFSFAPPDYAPIASQEDALSAIITLFSALLLRHTEIAAEYYPN